MAAVNTLILGAVQVSIFGGGGTMPKVPPEWMVGAAIALYPLVALPWFMVLRGHLQRALTDAPKA
jgi:hypothetical protein